MDFAQILAGRRSVKKFNRGHPISDDTLKSIFESVALAPSSFNLQHWRFVVVRDPAVKAKLRKAAFNQEQLETASAAIVVLGKLSAFRDAPRIYAETPQAVRDAMLPMIEGMYSASPALQRDEAIRSASLAAMTLMLAAQNVGYATGPMIGFDPAQVSEVIGLDADHVPVMLVVIGKQVGELRPRPFRLPVQEFVRQDSFAGPALR